jgi:hypothetical protein
MVMIMQAMTKLGVQRYAWPRYDTYRDTEVTIRYDTIQNDTHKHHTFFYCVNKLNKLGYTLCNITSPWYSSGTYTV